MKRNFILMTDSYKLSHHSQYPSGTTKIYSYLESRGGKFPKTMFFGLQYYLKEYLEGCVVAEQDVYEAKAFSKQHFGTDIFNLDGWMYIAKELKGKLPIKIKAVKEGSLVPVSNVLMTIENTDPNCYWLTNHCETLLMKIWASITVSTNSFYSKVLIAKYLKETGSTLDSLSFKLHDFGYRGVSSEESAGILGAAHLVNFMGTDTLAAILCTQNYYGSGMSGFSVPASEHSVACSFGKEHEEDYFLNMLEKYPTGIVSIVSDSYNIFNFVETMSSKYKNKILERQGTVVFRPDSGDPVEVNMRLIETLWHIFSGTYQNGYKLLVPQVRLIQGDGIDLEMIQNILNMAKAKGFAADNWVFGSGGGLLQKFDRDTQKFAIKASYGERLVDGNIVSFNLLKDPISATKKSKPGMLKLHKSVDQFTTLSSDYETPVMFNSYTDELQTVFENGEILIDQTFDEVRKTANEYFINELNTK